PAVVLPGGSEICPRQASRPRRAPSPGRIPSPGCAPSPGRAPGAPLRLTRRGRVAAAAAAALLVTVLSLLAAGPAQADNPPESPRHAGESARRDTPARRPKGHGGRGFQILRSRLLASDRACGLR